MNSPQTLRFYVRKIISRRNAEFVEKLKFKLRKLHLIL